MDPHLSRDPEYQNFVTVFRGFAYVGKVMEPYTKAGLQRVHQNAYRASAGLPPCLQRCSDLHGGNTTRWCTTCKTWKKILLLNRRGQFNTWENTKSWTWSNDFETITPVYLPSFWNNGDIKLNEFSTACHLWTTCKEFNIGNALLKKLRDFRNKHYGHNSDLKVVDTEKTKVFDALKSFVRENDVQAFINTGQCIQHLDSIANGDELIECLDEMKERLDGLSLKMDSHDAIHTIRAVCIEVCLSKIVCAMTRQNELLGSISTQLYHGGRLLKMFTICTVLIPVMICAILTFVMICAILTFGKNPVHLGPEMYPQYTAPSKQKECLSETYSHPFPQDLPLLPYIKEHSKLFGREWLFEEIEKYVGDTYSSEKGVLITADMGYGKSAIVKHLLCATNQDKKAYKIRSHIFSFHLCRFDVPSTKDPQRFVYRVVGFLSTKFPEFGGIISALPETALLYDQEKCRKEIIACFDQGILHPLGEMKIFDEETQVILIDALDECFDKRTNDNELYQLLIARYRQMPDWIKFIVTSRNISLIHNLHNFKKYQLDSRDHKNVEDIKQFVEFKASRYPKIRHIEGGLDKFIDQSEGSFLFVVHLMNYLTVKNAIRTKTLPETLSGVYEMNFERHFHSVDEYKVAKAILEIIITSLHPLSKNEIVNMLEKVNFSRIDITERTFEKIAFCFRSFQEITLVHQSLQSWLTSEDNRLFRVSPKRGHALLSQYLLNQINNTHADIVGIAIHIGNSNDPTLMKAFTGTFSSQNVTNSTLHKLIWKSDSAAVLELILNLHVDVDVLNEGNVTPAFVAAARGRFNQLKLLQSMGASLNFKVNDLYLITSSAQVDMIKHEYYFGYELIHIATQFGHLEIVRFLLKQNSTKRYIKNGLGLSVTEITCENGHFKLLELLAESESDFGNCLFYAAKNGHTHIVKRLAQLGVNASCISQDDALNAFNALNSRITMDAPIFSLTPFEIQNRIFNLNDSWWVVNQQSPLHSAIKAKFSGTAVALIKYYPQLMECVDAFGLTPFLLSVIENQTKVFEPLLERVTKDRCHNMSAVSRIETDSDRPICPVGGSYAHLDGIYGRYDMTKILYRNGGSVDWLAPDNELVTAVHYAACRGNMLFLVFIRTIMKHSFADIRSKNYSTPYHSAAICGSLGALYSMTDSFKNPLTDVLDLEQRTILHYIVMREFYGHPASSDLSEQQKSLSVLEDVLKSGMSIGNSDAYMRNLLHYALKNGHYLIVYHFDRNLHSTYKALLKERDIDGCSPVEYALRNAASLSFGKHIITPLNCTFYDIFFTYCGTEFRPAQYLTSWESGLFAVLETGDVANDFNNLFKDVIIKSPYLTTAVLVYLKDTHNLRDIRKHFIASIPESPPSLSVYALARHSPKLFSLCGKSLLESPLHHMAYKYNVEPLMTNLDFLHLAFGYPLNTNALSCADSRGYNSFHYALMGGNIHMAITLFDIGVSITNKKVSITDIPRMVLLAKKNVNIISSPECYDQLTCMDHLLQKILRKYKYKLLFLDFCLKDSAGLSLIHLVAASGLNSCMKFLYEKFGVKIIACRNKDRITPLYLWDLMNNQSASETFNVTTVHVPHPKTEEFLILGLLNDFQFEILQSSHFKCLYFRQKMVKCSASVLMSLLNDVAYLKGALNLYINQMVNDLINFENALFYKQGNIRNALLGVRFRANIFQIWFRKYDMLFNYHHLNKLIALPLNEINCEDNGPILGHLSCILLYTELNHMLNRVVAYFSKYFITTYFSARKHSHKSVTENYGFMLKRMKTLKFSTHEMFPKSSLFFDNEEFTDNTFYEELLFKHRSLNILKKTVKYQYMKEHIRFFSLFDTRSVQFKKLDFKTNIPKPFEEIFKYLNASSYSHIFENMR